jgi:hypothetical protein
MSKKTQPPESEDKAEASGSRSAKSPMQKFKGLTRHLLNVPRHELKTEQKRFQGTRAKAKHKADHSS